MKIDVLGVQVNADTKNTVLFLIKKLLGENKQVFITTPYSEMIVRAQKDTEFRQILNSADFTLPDGVGILWSAHYLKFRNLIASLFAIVFKPKSIRDPIPEKISGSEFVWDLARLAAERGYSVFLLGGFDDTPEFAAQALKNKFPNLKIAGTSAPVIASGTRRGNPIETRPLGLRPSEVGQVASESTPRNDELINEINSSSADFLFVALGPVRQEKWIAENLQKLPVKLAIGLGGTFDYLARKRALAPQIWRSTGLEWLWRLITQPWRLGRILRGVFGLIFYTLKAKV